MTTDELKFQQNIAKISLSEFKNILAETSDTLEANLLLRYRCAEDFSMFCELFFPHYATLPFGGLHRNKFDSYKYGERGTRRADAAPRGYAKSTISALFRVIWDVCYHQERYIIISSNTEEQSIQKVKDIRTELLDNRFLISVYGRFFSRMDISARSFIVDNRGHQVFIQSAGAKKELRGRRFGADRPTKIILDDFEHSTEVESEAIRFKTKKIFYDVFARLGNQNTNIEVVGTLLHNKSLLSDLLKNPGYERNKYKAVISWSKRQDLWDKWRDIFTDLDNEKNALDADIFFNKHKKEMLEGTEVLWEEHEDYLTLMKELILYGRRSFFKEKQNMPLSDEEKIFDPERVRYFTDHGDYFQLEKTGAKVYKEHLIPFGAIDPATGQRRPDAGRRGDFTCILTGYKDKRGRLFIYHDETKRHPPSQYIKSIIDLHEEFAYKKFGVEVNLYRNLLIDNIKEEWKKRKKDESKIRIHEIDQDENKEKRIYTIEPKVEHGWIVFNKNLSTEFFDQLWEFPKGDHDDCPDTLEMLWSLTHSRYVTGAVTL